MSFWRYWLPCLRGTASITFHAALALAAVGMAYAFHFIAIGALCVAAMWYEQRQYLLRKAKGVRVTSFLDSIEALPAP